MKEERKNNEERKRVLLTGDKLEGLVFYPHEGGGTFLPIVPESQKENAALAK